MSFAVTNLTPATPLSQHWAAPDAATASESLADQLRVQNVSISLAVPDRVRALIEQRLGEARRARVDQMSLQMGDRAPKLKLRDARDREVRLDSLLSRGPVVLSFYLGN